MARFDTRKRVLFLQLPLLDNDARAVRENQRLAAAYLTAAMERSGETRHYRPVIAGPAFDELDNGHVINRILRADPYAVAATLYVWNVERTLNVLRAVRRQRPETVLMVGGPEVARPHPFLFRSAVPDIAVCGEGEPVFPLVLRALRRGRRTDLATVAWRAAGRYVWGRLPPPEPPLADLLPPPAHRLSRPDENGVAYLESVRGCPARCTFCRYDQQRRRVSSLPVADVVNRIRILRRRGAREIRFIDPTFNAHPRFPELLRAMARVNADRRLRFFAELRADTVTGSMADRLAAANVREVEVGLQSGDPAVLRAVRRPGRPERVFAGIEQLAARGLRTTLDLMCGLPRQTLSDVRRSAARLARVRGARVQLLHTLLIPGTQLRAARARLGLSSQSRPPYRVRSSPTMSEQDMRHAERFVTGLLGRQFDAPARRFVGARLPDLFPERVRLTLDRPSAAVAHGGRANRRALLLQGRDLFGRRAAACSILRRAVRAEPDMLWQFVLCPVWEEPLDLLDALLQVLDDCPAHFLDRWHVAGPGTPRVARRIFVLLRRGRRFDPGWCAAAENLLSAAFV
ncbi:MAG: radical SAM protein [Kiritimatiellae bacterium]|nr:radical SAM protein [Kiritimatiellia bacterium]